MHIHQFNRRAGALIASTALVFTLAACGSDTTSVDDGVDIAHG